MHRVVSPAFLLKAASRRVLIDEPIDIVLANVPSDIKTVTIQARLKDPKGNFAGWAHVEPCRGVVNMQHTTSLGGSYVGVQPMGLFWSTLQEPGQRPGLRLLHRDVCSAQRWELRACSGHLNASELQTAEPLCSAHVERWYLAEQVERIPLTQESAGRLRGVLFVPKAARLDQRLPTVIDLFGTGGGLFEHRAALLASRGFLVLSLAIFNYEDLSSKLDFVDMDYFEEAVQWLTAHPCAGSRIGVVGLSKGADIGIEMACHFKKVAAVVAINGMAGRSFAPVRYRGKDSSFGEFDGSKSIFNPENNGFIMKNCFETALQHPYTLKSSSSRFLFVSGESDRSASPKFAQRMMKQLRELGPTHADRGEELSYEGAGHLIEPPYAPCFPLTYHNVYHFLVDSGGEHYQHHLAQMDLWRRMQSFLREALMEPVATKSKL